MTGMKSIINGKRLLGAALIMSLTAFAIWQTSSRSGAAQSVGGFEGFIATVTPISGPDPTLASVPVGGAFAIEGTIAFVNERGQTLNMATGKFYRTGTKINSSGTAVVQDVYVVQDFNGAIMAEGVLNPGIIGVNEQANWTAVVGGVGTYRGAQGEMQLTTNITGVGTTNATGTFTARLLEVPRRIGDDRVR